MAGEDFFVIPGTTFANCCLDWSQGSWREETVPLSEEELRLLEQMERALVAEDPKFASALRGTRFQRNARRRLFIAIGAFVVGIVVLMTGAVLQLTVVGIIGFVVMLVAAYVGLSSWRGKNSAPNAPTPSDAESPDAPFGLSIIDGGRSQKQRSPRNRSRGSMMDRFEERWRRRRDQDGGY